MSECDVFLFKQLALIPDIHRPKAGSINIPSEGLATFADMSADERNAAKAFGITGLPPLTLPEP